MAEGTMVAEVTDVDVDAATDVVADRAVALTLAGSFAAVDVEDVTIK
ncbi:hypothetical protein [Priestia koreensis]|nr:hypothetical protein [Priestia koreensis]UNL83004.1 hypothetical protein IE339_12425 [Priestia koreensis]